MYYEVKYNDYEDRKDIKRLLEDALSLFRRNYIATVYAGKPNNRRLYYYRELKTFDIKRIPTEDLYLIYFSYETEGVLYTTDEYRSVPYEYEEAFKMPKYDI